MYDNLSPAVFWIRNTIELFGFVYLFMLLDNRKHSRKKTVLSYSVFFFVFLVAGTVWGLADLHGFGKYITVTLLLAAGVFFPFMSSDNIFQVIYNITLQAFVLIMQIVFSGSVTQWFFSCNPWVDVSLRILFLIAVALGYTHWLVTPFREMSLEGSKGWLAMCLTSVFGCLLVVYFWTRPTNILERSTHDLVVFYGLWILLFLTHMLMIRLLFTMSKISKMKQVELHRDLLQSQMDGQRMMGEEIRRFRHDLRHHDMVIAEYVRNNDMEGLLAFLGERERENVSCFANYCENKTLSYMLDAYQKKAEAASVEMEIEAQARESISVTSSDLVAIVANILENALHGCRESNADKPFIHILIHEKSGKLVVDCENSCKQSLHFKEELPGNLHGIGISSIEEAAHHYGGVCDFSAQQGVFRCSVLLNIVSQ